MQNIKIASYLIDCNWRPTDHNLIFSSLSLEMQILRLLTAELEHRTIPLWKCSCNNSCNGMLLWRLINNPKAGFFRWPTTTAAVLFSYYFTHRRLLLSLLPPSHKRRMSTSTHSVTFATEEGDLFDKRIDRWIIDRADFPKLLFISKFHLYWRRWYSSDHICPSASYQCRFSKTTSSRSLPFISLCWNTYPNPRCNNDHFQLKTWHITASTAEKKKCLCRPARYHSECFFLKSQYLFNGCWSKSGLAKICLMSWQIIIPLSLG